MSIANHFEPVQKESHGREKILLVLLPFWDPYIPPMGISCLRGFLDKHGYHVKTVDANIEKMFTETYDTYFETLKQVIPVDKQSNFYNIGKDVLRNHMMAHIHSKDEKRYIELVKILVSGTFFCDIDEHRVKRLNELLDEFYRLLEEYFLGLLEEERPDVLGISVFKGSLPASLFAFRLTRTNFPQVKTVMGGGVFADQLAPGGPDWEFFMEKTPYIDTIIIGEGELLFLKYLAGELPGNKKVYTLTDINNQTLDISSVDIPGFSDFDLLYYPSLGAYTSRSCPFRCNFCSETVRWGTYRKKKAKQVASELTRLYETYGTQLFLMSDSLLNPIITGLANEIFKSNLSFYWDGYLRVDKDVCDPQHTLLWRRGGFYRARLGVESGSQRVLELMNKKVTPTQIRDALKSLAHAGIKTTTYWIIGYPGETEEDFQQTLQLVEELKNDIYEAEFNAFWYYESGQVKSNEWAKKSILLYPGTARDMLILQTRILDLPPSRQETYQRLNRIYQHAGKLGIPNPYSLYDIYKADERWGKLHPNGVPSLLMFKDKTKYLDECKHAKEFFAARDTQNLEGDWGF
ncbi:MAG: radical SAM protein [Candidatus Aminicenantes bacterium]|jgi:hypothetical protein